MYSYVCVLSTNNYLDGVLVVNECLKRFKSKYPLLCLINENITEETRKILDGFDIKYKEDKAILPSGLEDTRWKYTFDKLNIFKLTEYKKIVYLDSDFLILENIDNLFDIDKFTMVYDNNKDKYCSALMVIKPNIDDYNGLIKKSEEMIKESNGIIGDQNIINEYFDGINELPVDYNVIKGIENELVYTYDYIGNRTTYKYFCKDYYWSGSPKIIHYYGDVKPFMIDREFEDEYCYLYFYYLDLIRNKKDKIKNANL